MRTAVADRMPSTLAIALLSALLGAVLYAWLSPAAVPSAHHAAAAALQGQEPAALAASDGSEAAGGGGAGGLEDDLGKPLVSASYGVHMFPWPADKPTPDKISVVVMNWQRPHFVKQMIEVRSPGSRNTSPSLPCACGNRGCYARRGVGPVALHAPSYQRGVTATTLSEMVSLLSGPRCSRATRQSTRSSCGTATRTQPSRRRPASCGRSLIRQPTTSGA